MSRLRLVKALGYGDDLSDGELMAAAAFHIEQMMQAGRYNDYFPVPPGIMAQGEDHLSPKLTVEADGRIVITGGDGAVYLAQGFRLFHQWKPWPQLPWVRER